MALYPVVVPQLQPQVLVLLQEAAIPVVVPVIVKAAEVVEDSQAEVVDEAIVVAEEEWGLAEAVSRPKGPRVPAIQDLPKTRLSQAKNDPSPQRRDIRSQKSRLADFIRHEPIPGSKNIGHLHGAKGKRLSISRNGRPRGETK